MYVVWYALDHMGHDVDTTCTYIEVSYFIIGFSEDQ